MKTRTYAERHATALDLLDAMMAGAVDPNQMAQDLRARHGALGSFAIDVVLGDVSPCGRSSADVIAV